jgi:hypothetical protein
VIVAGRPTFTLAMSDSLKATVIVIVPVLTISANDELDEPPDEDEDELDPPRLPAVDVPPATPPPPPDEDELDDELLLAALEVDPADTESPGSRLASDAIVPLVGAYSLVSFSAVWALRTLASALKTAASAEAMLDGEGVVVVVCVVLVVEPLPPPLRPPEPPPPPLRPLEPPPPRPPEPPRDPPPEPVAPDPEEPWLEPVEDPVVVGLRVFAGVVVVVCVVVVVPLPGRCPCGGVYETNSRASETPVRLAFVVPTPDEPEEPDEPDEPDEPEEPDEPVAVPFSVSVSWSWAAVSWSSAWSSVSCAVVGSSVANSCPSVTCWPTDT